MSDTEAQLEPKILVVDDEAANLQKLQRTFVNRFPVLAASSGSQALELIEAHADIAVIIADQRMPEMTGIELLRRTVTKLPQAIRIILTGYTDVDVLMEAINSCKVFRYIVKPWDPPDLIMTVERGLESHRLAVENERYRRELVRRERLARELEIARDIQRYILPSIFPSVEGYEMAAEYHPAREVGGDIYDFHWDPESGVLQAIVGDVAGKSIPAALYGALFSGQMSSLFAQKMPPAEALSLLNRNLLARHPSGNYLAACHVHIEAASGAVLVSNGGMPYPYLIRDGKASQLNVSGVPLGLIPGMPYEQLSFAMLPGDILVLASDGTTDATGRDGGMYEVERFMASMEIPSEDLSRFVRNLYSRIAQYAGASLSDDIVIVAIRRS
jgi:sigma-B regulation protein RsbU (phosphoserine phosphatase)